MAHFSHPDPESRGQLHRIAPRQHRVILHVDGNNFFASCECLLRPELKEVPMAVETKQDTTNSTATASRAGSMDSMK